MQIFQTAGHQQTQKHESSRISTITDGTKRDLPFCCSRFITKRLCVHARIFGESLTAFSELQLFLPERRLRVLPWN